MWIFSATPVAFTIPGASADLVVGQARAANSIFHGDKVYFFHVVGHHLKAGRRNARYGYSSDPRFRGRITATADGVDVIGNIRPSVQLVVAHMLNWIVGPPVFALGVYGLVMGLTVKGTVIALVAGAVMTGIAVTSARTDRADHPKRARELVEHLRYALGQRPDDALGRAG